MSFLANSDLHKLFHFAGSKTTSQSPRYCSPTIREIQKICTICDSQCTTTIFWLNKAWPLPWLRT